MSDQSSASSPGGGYGMEFPADVSTPSFFSRVFNSLSVSSVAFVILFVSYVFYKGGNIFFVRFFSQPPDKYREAIEKAYNGNGRVAKSKVGAKKASYRRRFILAGLKPQLYSTVPLVTKDDTDCTDKIYQEIRIARIDKESNPDFMELVKPIEPDFPKRRLLYGFFHPYSYAGGGGERLLWEAVYVTLRKNPRNVALVYTFTEKNSDSVSSMLAQVRATFGINFFENNLNDRIVFLQLPNKLRWMADGRSYKFLTMGCQAIASFFLFFIAMNQCSPDVFIDTLGLPAAYPPARGWIDIPVVAYVHYPWVSSDMLASLKLRMKKRPVLFAKYLYWKLLAQFYSVCGSFLDISMCNSTWTQQHLCRVWTWADSVSTIPAIVYPPTGIDETKIKVEATDPRDRFFLYVAQYRPEKRHSLLLKEYAKYLELLPEGVNPHKLVLAGTTRSVDDEKTVEDLKALITELKIDESLVAIKVNAPRPDIDEYLQKADFGLNTMWNEHFGISVVEYMLYGAIPIVHASAGPLLDIVVPINPKDGVLLSKSEREGTAKIPESFQSGFFFKDPSDPDYTTSPLKFPKLSEVFVKVSSMSDDDKLQYRKNAMAVADKKFSQKVFQGDWSRVVQKMQSMELVMREQRGKVEKLY